MTTIPTRKSLRINSIREDGELPQRSWPSLGEFVTGYLSVVYARQATDTIDTVWCRQWWQHPEALERLTLLWRTREQATTAARVSSWWLGDCEPHMSALLSVSGPFKYCATGHKTLLRPLPTDLDAAHDAGLFTPAHPPVVA
ncbi:DUF4913 domain-containing protein [Nocardia sp. alder85J]|uniref:DUF4913 domain-containing protein n=1 Tax=Nocardia sp. alder85J TaxID=2862949 RepID=UPI001CD61D2A|nr:DUF4913 domain-containing protein [Nocardia sp. alder85J]MCX4093661.1 DUF4913 domain-containing protein [Nocardia sp. alder85J]